MMERISKLPYFRQLNGMWLFAVVMVILSIIGGVREYSPVPFWDIWDGTIDFFIRLQKGDVAAWWGFHNEHRIILSRLLFWIDFKWFDGLGWFLVAMNYVLVGCSAFLFLHLWRLTIKTPIWNKEEKFFAAFLVICLFSWVQAANLESAFQSQFILAQLLPLAALYYLHNAIKTNLRVDFVKACILGILSAGTMGNGILALPCMVGYAFLARASKNKIALLLVLSTIVIGLYLSGYASSAPGSLGKLNVEEFFFEIPTYVLLYLGGPFGSVMRGGVFGAGISLIAGIIFLYAVGKKWVLFFRSEEGDIFQLVLLVFILYILGTAYGTALGRISIGVGQALSGRYTTPMIMAWLALFILYKDTILAGFSQKRKWVIYSFGALLFFMALYQLKALKPQYERSFVKNIAAMALSLQVPDVILIHQIYPDHVRALSVAKEASDLHLSIFGLPDLKDIRKQLGKKIVLNNVSCGEGNGIVNSILQDKNFLGIGGMMVGRKNFLHPTMRVVNSVGNIVGYVTTQERKWNFLERIKFKMMNLTLPSLIEYRGYILADKMDTTLLLVDYENTCVTPILTKN